MKDTQSLAGSDLLWRPTAEAIGSAAIAALIDEVNDRHGLRISSYSALHRWSVTEPEQFWPLIWDRSVRRGSGGDVVMLGEDVEHARFFPEARLNVADELIGQWDRDRLAVVGVREDGTRTQMTRGELEIAVTRAANALRRSGVVAGDRVVAWTPDRVEVVVFALAALRIGALVSTASPDFAPPAVIDRFSQIEPKAILGVTEYQYRGRSYDVADRFGEIVAGLPSIGVVITLDSAGGRWPTWDEWSADRVDDTSAPESEQFDFAHPGFILFSSGTTGKPKCIVHSAAGVLLKLRAELEFNVGLRSDDVLFFYCTTGWMMWNWVLYALGTGATIVLYDGHPMYPVPERLFTIAAENDVTALGVSAKYIDSLRVAQSEPMADVPQSGLRILLSTGSPLSPESFDYVYASCIAQEAQLISMSGGTDICGAFVGGVPTEPVYRGEMQGAILGMAADIFAPSGRPAHADETGELVCTAPFPSAPLGFWGDAEGAQLHKSYFSGFPGVWTHGDFARKTERGGFVILGRSDATLNSKGVRIGTAEIYGVVDAIDGVQESLAVAQDWEGDSRIILFVCLIDGRLLDDEMIAIIRTRLRQEASPRHVPDLIVRAPELPRTRSNKLVELTVADIVNGRAVRNVDALENPETLDWFVNFANSSREREDRTA